jgi:hypothetical protein
MISIDRWRGPLLDHLVFCAAGSDVAELAARCRPYELFRVRHALDAEPPRSARRTSQSLTAVIDLTREPEAIYRSLDAKSCRYEIRRAEKLGGRLSLRRNDARSRHDVRSLFNRLLAPRYTKPISRRRYAGYLPVADTIAAYVDDDPVAAHLLVRDPVAQRVRLVFSVSTRFEGSPHRHLAGPANRWLHWQELQLYRGEGFLAYDFGGLNPTSSIGRFKLSFGGVPEHGMNVLLAGAFAELPFRAAEHATAALVRRRTTR